MKPLCHRTVYELLVHIDSERADQVRARGCPICGAALHAANYRRKPRGLSVTILRGLDTRRFSFCCSREGCRIRVTPPSVRFLGRRVYLAAIVALVTASRQGPTPSGLRRLKSLLGVDRKTVTRWRRWWQESFPESGCWRLLSGRLVPPVRAHEMPRGLMERFTCEGLLAKLVALLKFVARGDWESRYLSVRQRPAQDGARRRSVRYLSL